MSHSRQKKNKVKMFQSVSQLLSLQHVANVLYVSVITIMDIKHKIDTFSEHGSAGKYTVINQILEKF